MECRVSYNVITTISLPENENKYEIQEGDSNEKKTVVINGACMLYGSMVLRHQHLQQENEETVELTALISKHSLTKDVNEMEWLTGA